MTTTLMTIPGPSGLASRLICLVALLALTACGSGEPEPVPDLSGGPHVVAETPVDAGRYLAIVAGCNDCHTDGYLLANGDIPEEDWFMGSSVGFRGPWGTTYASNLRKTVEDMTEDDWADTMHLRDELPPMPWMNANEMSEKDARAIYQYIVSLGPKGDYVPANLPPGAEPATPFFVLEPRTAEPAPDPDAEEGEGEGPPTEQ